MQVVLPQPMSFDEITHDHALLESLYNSVFTNRFINPTPSSSHPPKLLLRMLRPCHLTAGHQIPHASSCSDAS
ncbi:hypothetical protein BC629DRAFT_519797 [Irpex lacteus]|nr:hypothetical protein BC629DRAFT_519797 [Irpex lacteus]